MASLSDVEHLSSRVASVSHKSLARDKGHYCKLRTLKRRVNALEQARMVLSDPVRDVYRFITIGGDDSVKVACVSR